MFCDVLCDLEREGVKTAVSHHCNRITFNRPLNHVVLIRLLITEYYGVLSRQKKRCGLGFFSFPMESVRKKTWTIFCRREDFVPTKNSRLCSVHFSKDQLDRDPDKLRENGYDGANIRLTSDAHPDIRLLLQQPKEQP